MKKIIALTIIMLMMALIGCSEADTSEYLDEHYQQVTSDERQVEDTYINSEQNVDASPSAEKIVIITNPIIYAEDEYLSAEALVARFGQERVIHKTWPGWSGAGVTAREETINNILKEISENTEVKAVVLTESTHRPSVNTYVVDALHHLRDDIFVVFVPSVHSERLDYAAGRVDLIIQTDMQRFGELFVIQAISMGVDTIVHYSSPLHRTVPAFAMRRDAMKFTAEREGISFIDLDAPCFIGAMTLDILERNLMYIAQDLPRQVEMLGVNTAFFGTACIYQSQIISQTIATGAIFVSTCCSSPFHGYPEALEVEYRVPTGEYDEFGSPIIQRLDLSELIKVIDEAVYAAGMTGRVSSHAVSDNAMWTTIGFMYALEWLEGNVSQEHGIINIENLARLAREFTLQLGIDAEVTLEIFNRDGETIPHHILGDIGYHVFG